MAVYVDDMKAKFRNMVMCMLADTDTELIEMAKMIGVPIVHHQGDHFDICMSKREKAVALGAIEITQRQAVLVRRAYQ